MYTMFGFWADGVFLFAIQLGRVSEAAARDAVFRKVRRERFVFDAIVGSFIRWSRFLFGCIITRL